jgi:nucleoside-diphosphate-sugar epimerase
MKTLVTGATGMVGSHIVEKLHGDGQQVVALVRSGGDTRFLESLGIELRYGSITDPIAVYEAVKGMDRVCHAAALTEEWASPEESYEVNVEGTENLLEAAMARDVGRFFFVSSLAVLGFHSHYNTGMESDYVKCGDPYIDTKMDAEKLVRRFSRFGLATTILRPGFMYGPHDRRFLKRILSHLENGTFRFIGDGKNKMNLNYAGNFADAVLLAAKTPRSIGQVYNIANDDKSLDMETFIFKVADLWGYPRPHAHIPVIVARAVMSLMEGSARLMKKKEPPYLTKTRFKFLSYNLEFDISKAREELGFENRVRIDEGLALTKQWMEASREDDRRAEEERAPALHVQARPHD